MALQPSPFLITTLKPVPRGTEGAVSVEGYAAGIVGSILLGSIALNLGVINLMSDFICCLIAALIGTTAESFIGATMQEDNGLSNEAVNFINTLIGAVAGMSMSLAWTSFIK